MYYIWALINGGTLKDRLRVPKTSKKIQSIILKLLYEHSSKNKDVSSMF
jgi:hypothetical protein